MCKIELRPVSKLASRKHQDHASVEDFKHMIRRGEPGARRGFTEADKQMLCYYFCASLVRSDTALIW